MAQEVFSAREGVVNPVNAIRIANTKNNARKKTIEQLEQQYKRVLKKAFPKLKFKGVRWNWHEVYEGNPYENKRFVSIQNAFINDAKRLRHPFYT